MMSSIDALFSNTWNEFHPDAITAPEHFWDICRELSSYNVLQFDAGAVSTVQIGPFYIASNLELSKRSIFTFFLESVFPMIIANTSDLSFNEAYPLYILPAIKVLLYFLNNVYLIDDLDQWEMLICIKSDNENGFFLTPSEISKKWGNEKFCKSINSILSKLSSAKNIAGNVKPLISFDENGRVHSLV